MGEILACGRPIVASSNVGDVAEILRRYRVGVLVDNFSEAALRHAVAELQALLKDPELPARCRYAAEDFFSLNKGVAAYDELYRGLPPRLRRAR
jgi:glycosyltransferase involved in cell wall biosynthesis